MPGQVRHHWSGRCAQCLGSSEHLCQRRDHLGLLAGLQPAAGVNPGCVVWIRSAAFFINCTMCASVGMLGEWKS